MRDVGLHAQKRGWARDFAWIAGRGRWSRYREPHVPECGSEGDCVGLPRRDLWLYQESFVY